MAAMGKTIILAGCVLVAVGLLVLLIERLGGQTGRLLPGDLVVRKGRFTFYFPIVTCIALSMLLTLALYVVHLLRR
ncbi:MAG: DUF2905 domain-containing protein [Armatimonadota bacterium]